MSVLKIGDIFHYRFMHRGKVIRKSTKQGNHKVALAMEAAHKTALAKGDAGLGEKPPAPPLAKFLMERVSPWADKKKVTTRTWYQSGIKPLLAYAPLSNRALDQITTEHIDDYTAFRLTHHAVGTVNRELRVLRRCLRLAVEWRLLEKSAMADVSMAGAEKRRERVVKDEEFQKYIAYATPLLADVAIVLNETGLRPEECHGLEWPDINLAGNQLLVRHGKTAAARRQLPLTRNVRGILECRWQAAGCPEMGFVFFAPTKSGHIQPSTLKKQHRNALSKSGVRSFVLYSLRHTFGTRIAPHVDAWTLCKIMGWASLSVAMTYIHASEERVLAAFSGHEFGHAANWRLPNNSGDQPQVAREIEGYMVSAAGFEPATHALKGHCSTN
jgi:integrase